MKAVTSHRTAKSECKDNLLLDSILTWRERIQRHEEVRKVSAVAQLALNEKQSLPGDFLAETVIEAKVISANVDAAAGSQIVVGELRDEGVRAFDREHIKERHVSALGCLSDLQRSQHRVAFVQLDANVAGGLNVEDDRIGVAAALKPCPVNPVCQARNLKISRGINCATRRGSRVACSGERT